MVELNFGLVVLMSNSKLELQQHYLDTTYLVFINDEQYDIKINKLLPPAIQELIKKEKTAAVLTAWNPRSQKLSLVENKSRNLELKRKLNNYLVFEAAGQGADLEWITEESFFILGVSKKDVELLAVEYEQYAYVWLQSGNLASLEFSSIWQSLRTE